jgi:predicted dinucleotide-binding enzyme
LAVPYPAVSDVLAQRGQGLQHQLRRHAGLRHDRGQPTTVLIAGDDAEAKSKLAEVVTAGGVRAIDAGSLRRARELEAIGFLQITLAAGEKLSWTGGFAGQP